MKRVVKIVLWILLVPVLCLFWLWTLGAAYYMSGGSRSDYSTTVAAGYAFVTLVIFWRFRRATVWWVVGSFAAGLLWYLSLQPSNDRDWTVDVARMPSAVSEGDKVTIRNVRNFHYRSVDDFDVAYYDKTYDLSKLDSVDLVLCYWDGHTEIAHTMLSFGFGGKDHVCLSAETRKEKGEAWGGLPGIYRQFEIIYILGDERDLVDLRTSYRKEDVYLYHLVVPRNEIRQYFVQVLKQINKLNEKPEFYGTLAYNCSSALTDMSKKLWPERRRIRGIQTLLNGHTDEYAYENGRISNKLPFEELRRRSYITPVGQKYKDDPDFSRKIREGLP